MTVVPRFSLRAWPSRALASAISFLRPPMHRPVTCNCNRLRSRAQADCAKQRDGRRNFPARCCLGSELISIVQT